MAPDEPAEIELKLLLPRGQRPALEAHPALHGPGAGPPEERQEHTEYFDTKGLGLARKGLSLRVRRSGGKRIQTLKSAPDRSAVAGSRGEWEWQIEQDAPDLARIAETPFVAEVLAEAADGLEPVFQTDIRRTVRRLHLPGGATVEAAFDEGTVSAGDAAQEVSELELELKEGARGPLYRLALELLDAAPFTIGTESKAERGRRLRTGEVPCPVQSAPPPLQKDSPAGAAARSIITAELSHILANQPAAAVSDVEGVHQMRVGIRRLRTVLALFHKHLGRQPAARFEAELKRLGQVFGAARDWDVFCTETLAAAARDESASEWARTLLGPAETERRAAHRQVQQELQRPALTALVLGMAAWAEPGGGEAEGIGGRTLERPLAKLAPALLDRMARRVHKRGRHLRRRSATDLHRLRKALKELRYSAEYLAGLYRPKQVRRYQKAAKRVLKLLGASNDARVAASLAERLAGSVGAELGQAAAELAKWSARRGFEARRKLPKAWAAFAAVSPFWRSSPM